MIDRQLPQNIEIEESLIAALIINNENYHGIEYLAPDDFYSRKNQETFRAIKGLIESNNVADLSTIAKKLQERKVFTLAKGGAFLATMVDNSPLAIDPRATAKIIKGCSIIRRGTHEAMKIADLGFSNPDPDEFISKFQQAAMGLETSKEDEILNGNDLAHETLTRIERAITDPGSDGLLLGFYEIDEITRISGSLLILISARPKVGKTAFMTSIVENMCNFGHTVGVLSLEMDRQELSNRWIAKLADINPMRFNYSGNLTTEEIKRISKACDHMSTWKLFIDDHGGDISDVRRKCRKMKKLGCDAIFIDQLSKIKGKGNQFERYTENCSEIAMLKKELRIPIFLLCQINREAERQNRPTMANLKQTGALEEDADMIFILHREEGEKHKTDVILAAHRHGGTRDFKLHFNPQRIHFSSFNNF
ncbi:MAG: hypothetical protein KKF12_12240 [Proteobacteria bacterium]|nr:hypothetical protein [Pseudomonadota bacterium]MBU4131582.1 hypothetical protein [Pseudomonadota bacterium]